MGSSELVSLHYCQATQYLCFTLFLLLSGTGKIWYSIFRRDIFFSTASTREFRVNSDRKASVFFVLMYNIGIRLG